MKGVGKFLIVVLLIVAIAGGGLAYAYFNTDLLKSNKEMFFKYILQNGDVMALFDEPGIIQVSEKQTTKPQSFTSKLDIEYPNDKVIDDLNIVVNGKTDMPNEQYDYEVNLNYNETVGIPYRFIFDGDTIAVNSPEIVSQFVGVKNENLKRLVEKFGMDSRDIPNEIKIEIPDFDKYYFTENEKSIINYNELVENSFMEDSFSKSKAEDGSVVYTLTTTTNAVRDLTVGLLEAVKGENLIINKVVSIFNDASETETPMTSQDVLNKIDEMIKSLKETDVKSKEVKINVYAANKDLVKTEVVSEGFNLVLVANENKFEYDIQTKTEDDDSRIIFSMDKTRSQDNLKYVIATKFFGEGMELLNIDIDYMMNGIDTQNKVTTDVAITGKIIDITSEEYKNYSNIMTAIEMESFYSMSGLNSEYKTYTEEDLENALKQLGEKELLSLGIKISTTSDFTAEVEFEELDYKNLIALNDFEYGVLENIFQQIATNFNNVHENKLKEAGIEEDPYLAVPKALIGMYILSSSTSSIESAMSNMNFNNTIIEGNEIKVENNR